MKLIKMKRNHSWIVFFLFESSIVLGMGFNFGPSLETLLDNSRGRPTQEIHLESYVPAYSVAIPLYNDSTTGSVGKFRPNGEFIVNAPPQHGIMVVIQALRLRTHVVYADKDDTTYLKCRDLLKLNAGNQSANVCGHVTKYSKEGRPAGLLGPRTFMTSDSRVTVSLQVDNPLHEVDYGRHETIVVELVFTAYKSCPQKNFVPNWLKKFAGRNAMRSCSPSEDRICVYESNFCDGVAECGIQGPLGHLGYDEENCGPFVHSPTEPPFYKKFIPTMKPPTAPTTTKTPYIGVNKPYSPPTGAVISPIHLILIFSTVVLVIFGACTWLAKANEKKFQHTMYRFNTLRRNRRSNPQQRAQRGGDETIQRHPSAPPVVPSSETLDLEAFGEIQAEVIGENQRHPVSSETEEPPPYDDLFPSAPPFTNTPTPPPLS